MQIKVIEFKKIIMTANARGISKCLFVRT